MSDFTYCLKKSKDGTFLCRLQKGHDGQHAGLKFVQPKEVYYD